MIKFDLYPDYQNNGECNFRILQDFNQATESISWLLTHRTWIENNESGFGYRAFHYFWYLALKKLALSNSGEFKALEIGVYQGQILSLWSLILKKLNIWIFR